METILHALGFCGDHNAHFSVIDFLGYNYDLVLSFVNNFKNLFKKHL